MARSFRMRRVMARLTALGFTASLASITFVLLAGPAPVGAQTKTVGDPVADRSAEALDHFRQGRFEEALRGYQDALVQRPESTPLRLNVGDALYQMGDYEAAAREFEQAAASTDASLSSAGYYNLGNSRFQLQDYAGAVEAYREALQRAPGDVDAKANLELALQRLQSPPPQQQQQPSNDGSEGEDEGDQQQQEQPQPSDEDQQQDEPGPSPPTPDDQTPDDQTPDDQMPDESQDSQPPSSSPDEAESETGEDPGEAQPSDGPTDPMDEEEAEQLLDALADREEEGQRRRFRNARRRSDEQDW